MRIRLFVVLSSSSSSTTTLLLSLALALLLIRQEVACFTSLTSLPSSSPSSRTIRVYNNYNPTTSRNKKKISSDITIITSTRLSATTTELEDDVDDNVHTTGTVIHLNHAGASPSPNTVLERVIKHMKLEQKLGGYAAAELVKDELNSVYDKVCQLIHARNPHQEIALMESATVAFTKIFYTIVYAIQQQNEKDKNSKQRNVILISDVEYAANVVAICKFATEYNWVVLSLPSSVVDGKSTGIVDIEQLDKILSGTYKYKDHGETTTKILDPDTIGLICITHIPTNCGIINPIEQIGQMIQSYNDANSNNGDSDNIPSMYYIVDTCQSIGHVNVDVQTIQCHGLIGTGRKYLRGPRGTGFLYVSSSIVNDLIPNHIDHYGIPITLGVPSKLDDDGDNININKVAINENNIIQYQPRVGATRFEYWESNIANKLGLGVAIQYCIDIGIDSIEADIKSRSKYLRNKLKKLPKVNIYHGDDSTCGIVTFSIIGMEGDDIKNIKQQLFASSDTYKFEVSTTQDTSTPIDSLIMDAPKLLIRVSVSYTTTTTEIDLFCIRLLQIINGSN